MKLLTAAAGLAGKLLGALGLSRAWLTMLMVAIIGAGFYVAWARTNARAEALAAWINVACASAGTTFSAAPGKRSGSECQAQIAALANFRDDTTRVTAEALAEAATTRDGKLIADTAATRRAAEAARDAAQSMEDANADLKDDRVSGAWFDAFNHAAGMHPAKR